LAAKQFGAAIYFEAATLDDKANAKAAAMGHRRLAASGRAISAYGLG
jgi:hypothetical protein